MDTIFPALFRCNTRTRSVITKVSLMLVLMTVAGVAAAHEQCELVRGTNRCVVVVTAPPLKAPEIDAASAMAGLTMLACSLAVVRGRRRVQPSKP
jgi:threonine synthase